MIWGYERERERQRDIYILCSIRLWIDWISVIGYIQIIRIQNIEYRIIERSVDNIVRCLRGGGYQNIHKKKKMILENYRVLETQKYIYKMIEE